MPTTTLMQLPRTKSAEEFENICIDVLQTKYNIPFYKYGRLGQAQHGIDLYGTNNEGSNIVVQCKNYLTSSYNKLQNQIAKDISSTSKLPFSIDTFIIMTSLSSDINIQNQILERISESRFKIEIYFWEDIQKVLCENPLLLKKHYPNFFNNFYISIEDRNELIENAHELMYAVKFFIDNMGYQCAYNQQSDTAVYNMCVTIKKSEYNLHNLYDKLYIQLKSAHLIKPIEYIINNTPEFYDENQDGTGSSMTCTISNFLDYFSDKNKKGKFIKNCQLIIKYAENYDDSCL